MKMNRKYIRADDILECLLHIHNKKPGFTNGKECAHSLKKY